MLICLVSFSLFVAFSLVAFSPSLGGEFVKRKLKQANTAGEQANTAGEPAYLTFLAILRQDGAAVKHQTVVWYFIVQLEALLSRSDGRQHRQPATVSYHSPSRAAGQTWAYAEDKGMPMPHSMGMWERDGGGRERHALVDHVRSSTTCHSPVDTRLDVGRCAVLIAKHFVDTRNHILGRDD